MAKNEVARTAGQVHIVCPQHALFLHTQYSWMCVLRTRAGQRLKCVLEMCSHVQVCVTVGWAHYKREQGRGKMCSQSVFTCTCVLHTHQCCLGSSRRNRKITLKFYLSLLSARDAGAQNEVKVEFQVPLCCLVVQSTREMEKWEKGKYKMEKGVCRALFV